MVRAGWIAPDRHLWHSDFLYARNLFHEFQGSNLVTPTSKGVGRVRVVLAGTAALPTELVDQRRFELLTSPVRGVRSTN